MKGSSVGSSQSCGIVTTERRRCAKVPFIAFWSPINKLLTLSQRRTLCHQLASYTVMMSRPCRAVRGPKVNQPRVHLHPMSRVWHRCKALQDCAVCSPLSTSVGSLNSLPALRSQNFLLVQPIYVLTGYVLQQYT